MEVAKPIFLNPLLQVVSYNGEDAGKYKLQNALEKDSGKPHCTPEGKNFDLILKATDDKPITLTNVIVKKAARCTCPIKSGVVNVFSEAPKEADLAQFNDYKPSEEASVKPTAYFLLPTKEDTVEVKLEHWKTGNFIHVKFIDPYILSRGSINIDVGFIGFVGFVGNAPAEYDVGNIDEELGISPLKLKKFNLMVPDFANEITTKTLFAIFVASPNEDLKKVLKEVAEGNHFQDDQLLFMWGEGPFAEKVRGAVGFPAGTVTAVFNFEGGVFYIHEGENTVQALIKFGQDALAGTAKKFIKSQEPTPNDRDPSHPELYRLNTNNFEPLVLKSDKEFFVDVWAEWCGPCVAVGPTISLLAKTLADVPTVGVGKINCDYNVVDKKYFPESGIPNMKFFSASNKEAPVKYAGDRSLKSFITFVHTHATHKFDLDKYLAIGEEYSKAQATIDLAHNTQKAINKQLAKYKEKLSAEDLTQLESLLKSLKEEEDKGTKIQPDNVKKVVEEWEKSPEKKKMEKFELKNVNKVHSHEEYLQFVEKSKSEGKLLVVDFFATWCGPCVYIAPILADWSEQFLDVLFLKVDVDELEETSQSVGISCMPTFKFYKGGEVVHTIEGADKDEVQAKITELK